MQRTLATGTCGLIFFMYKCRIFVGQSEGGADGVASLQEKRELRPSSGDGHVVWLMIWLLTLGLLCEDAHGAFQKPG